MSVDEDQGSDSHSPPPLTSSSASPFLTSAGLVRRFGLGRLGLGRFGLGRLGRRGLPLRLPHLLDVLVQDVGALVIPRLEARAGVDDPDIRLGIDRHAVQLAITGEPAAEDLGTDRPVRLLGGGVFQGFRIDRVSLDQDVENRRRIDRGIDQAGVLGGHDGLGHGMAGLLQLLLDLLGNGRSRGFDGLLGLLLGGLLLLRRFGLGFLLLGRLLLGSTALGAFLGLLGKCGAGSQQSKGQDQANRQRERDKSADH